MAEEIERFDAYNQKASDAAKPAIAAVVLLNSGAWLALLSQVSGLAELEPRPDVSTPFVLWTTGAALGVSMWLVAYTSAYLIAAQFHNDGSKSLNFWIRALPILGLALGVVSICCFLFGSLILAYSLM